jgi:hypothetical protein
MYASEEFELLAFRGDDIEFRESWVFHIINGEKAKEMLKAHEENSFADYLIEFTGDHIDNQPNREGQLKRVKGIILFCENNENIKFVNVKFEWVKICAMK